MSDVVINVPPTLTGVTVTPPPSPPVAGTVQIGLPPAGLGATVILPDGTPLPVAGAVQQQPVIVQPPGLSVSQAQLPARGAYTEGTVAQRIDDLVDRKVEREEIGALPDLKALYLASKL